jgi:plastocyanin domain-containing protein
MTHLTTPAPRHSTNTRRLRRTIGYALVRGAAQATGTGLIGLLFWWLTHK